MIEQILKDLVSNVAGTRAVIFLDDEGETIAHAGDAKGDLRLIGAWKEIQLDLIRDICRRLGLGGVRAVLFSLEESNELIVPVSGDYCLLVILSAYSDMRQTMSDLQKHIEILKKEI